MLTIYVCALFVTSVIGFPEAKGKLDPKWCTSKDCKERGIIQENHKTKYNDDINKKNGTCIPGSISNDDCNFCICNENGLLKERSCTNNSCSEVERATSNLEKLTCEPLTNYSIDCNICYCPSNGLKNIVKCTKNSCDKNILRSDVCIPGDLFSEECNVCVCPPNGHKSDKVCTKNKCRDSDTPERKILKTIQSFMSQASVKSTISSELCYPGEEFKIGCKVCVCPDNGLRVYAVCTPMFCDDDNNKEESNVEDQNAIDRDERKKREVVNCRTVNVTNSSERKECTPGSMYIIRCQQCICPYMGSINWFCKPMPKGTYCEQAFPGINYLINGRRNPDVDTNKTSTTSETSTTNETSTARPPHAHTFYTCDKPGHITDECFICECQNNFVIEEHCFRNEDEDCINKRPTFLNKEKLFLD